jgi:hypothetical protein
MTAVEDMSVREFLDRGERIRNCILDMAENPFLELFLRLIYFFGAKAPMPSIYLGHPERMQRMEARQWRVGEAVLDGEPEVTVALHAEGWRLIESWLEPHGGTQAVQYLEKKAAPVGRIRKKRQPAD